MSAKLRIVPDSVSVALSSSGDLIAAPGDNRKIIVLGWVLTLDTDGDTFKFQSGASTDKTGAMSKGSAVMAPVPEPPKKPETSQWGIFKCEANEKLNVVMTGTGNLTGIVHYYIWPSVAPA